MPRHDRSDRQQRCMPVGRTRAARNAVYTTERSLEHVRRVARTLAAYARPSLGPSQQPLSSVRRPIQVAFVSSVNFDPSRWMSKQQGNTMANDPEALYVVDQIQAWAAAAGLDDDQEVVITDLPHANDRTNIAGAVPRSRHYSALVVKRSGPPKGYRGVKIQKVIIAVHDRAPKDRDNVDTLVEGRFSTSKIHIHSPGYLRVDVGGAPDWRAAYRTSLWRSPTPLEAKMLEKTWEPEIDLGPRVHGPQERPPKSADRTPETRKAAKAQEEVWEAARAMRRNGL